jgi:hypothetical protein
MAGLDAMPPEMRQGASQAIAEMIRAESRKQKEPATASQTSEGKESAGGPEEIPLTLPIDLQVSAELTAVG